VHLERWIRAIAGSFVVVSMALGYWVDQRFYLFAAFVGLNLLQSAFTGFCPMEKILHRLGVKSCEEAVRERAVHDASA